MCDIKVLLCVLKFWWKRLYIVLASSVVIVIFKSLCKVKFETYQEALVTNLSAID